MNTPNTNIQSSRSKTEQRIITLLGSGLSASVVANAVGVSESRISQLMSDKEFADEVSTLKFQSLQKHNEMDDMYDKMEKTVANRLDEMLPMITRPSELLKSAQILNQMKRRGMSSPDQMVSQTQVVQLLMPVAITQKFTTNINNQVIHAGEQTLQTIQGSTLLAAAKTKTEALSQQAPQYVAIKELNHEQSNSPNQTPNSGSAQQTASTGTAQIYKQPV